MSMQSASIAELSARARDVFRQIVESYVETGSPIGSRTISKLSGLGLSAASIRNVMQDLEEMGLLASPHTSAGRIPTETGLRLFVDGMMQAAELSEAERQAIERQLHAGPGRIEEALSETTAVLSGLSACAGIVLVPKGEPVIRQIGFVPLPHNQALAVLVGGDGSVENRVMDLTPGVSPSALIEAGNWVSARLAGLTLQQAAQKLESEISQHRAAKAHPPTPHTTHHTPAQSGDYSAGRRGRLGLKQGDGPAAVGFALRADRGGKLGQRPAGRAYAPAGGAKA